MLFNPRAAKSLKPGEHLIIEGCQGLRLEARESCATWVYRYKTPEGKMRQVALGQWPRVSAADAAAAWSEARDLRASGLDPKAHKKRPVTAAAPSGYTVKALLHDYLENHIDSSRKEAGAVAARRALNRLLETEPDFAASQAEAITRGVAFQIIEARKATPTAAAKLRSMLGGAWDYGLDAGRLGEAPNWWRLVQKGRLKSKGKIIGGEHLGRQRRALNEREVGQLVGWLHNMTEHARDVTLLYLWTCARGAEILSMRPEHIFEEPDGWWWIVPKALTKNAKVEFATDYRVPLIGRALEIVMRRMECVGKTGNLIECRRGTVYRQKDYSTYIYDHQPYSVKSQRRGDDDPAMVLPVSGWTPHDLRRTQRTMLASIGCPAEIAEALLGHLPRVLEATYNVHSYDAERREWLTKLDAHLDRIIADHSGLPALP